MMVAARITKISVTMATAPIDVNPLGKLSHEDVEPVCEDILSIDREESSPTMTLTVVPHCEMETYAKVLPLST